MVDKVTGKFLMNVNQMIKQLSNSYVTLVNNSIPFKKFPSVMLWGPPGVGKSQGVREIADIIESKTGKKVVITDVRLLLFNPVDLRGIPTANQDKTLAVWLKPKIFQMDESEETVNILFLDEISAAPPSVQAAAYQITLDRVVGEHRLPDNCIVIAAGNRVSDKSVAYSMPKALANRMCHMDISCDYESWRTWAEKAGVHESIIGYLNYKPEMLMQQNNRDSNAFATPRSWEMVSNLLNYISDNLAEIYPMVAGCVGVETAADFLDWYEILRNIPPVDEIFDGTYITVPKIPRVIFAIASQIAAYAHDHHGDKELDNAIQYVYKFPTEFRNKVFTDFLRIKEVRPVLRRNETFCSWFELTNHSWEYYK